MLRLHGARTTENPQEGVAGRGGLPTTEGRLFARVLARVGLPPVRLELWNGEAIEAGPDAPAATLSFRERPAVWRLLLDTHRYLGDAYADGRVELTGDLVQFLEAVYRRNRPAERFPHRLRRRHRNSLAGSRQNVRRHYDVGNDFYRLWLDEQLVYTCAYFETPDASLEAAQRAKMDLVCRKLRLGPGDRVVEAGCGWGSLALHMARRYGVTVRAFNLSREQVAYARARALREGMAKGVEYIEDDYRNIEGTYDAFVSVGMLEHVGVENYARLGTVIDRVLAPSGRGLIHTIGRHRPLPFNRWMDASVFPGAHIPALSEMMTIFEPRDFCVLDVENLRLHYALTLRHWLARFEAASPRIAEMFDESFVRSWRLYLAGSIAAFTTGWTQLFQVVFNRHNHNNVPWTRAYLYAEPGSAGCSATT